MAAISKFYVLACRSFSTCSKHPGQSWRSASCPDHPFKTFEGYDKAYRDASEPYSSAQFPGSTDHTLIHMSPLNNNNSKNTTVLLCLPEHRCRPQIHARTGPEHMHAQAVTCSGGTGQISDSDERREMDTGRFVHISLRAVSHGSENNSTASEQKKEQSAAESTETTNSAKINGGEKSEGRTQARAMKINKLDSCG